MTKEEAQKRLPIIQALAEGKPIQAMYLHGGYGVDYNDWDCMDELDFNNYVYRVKPEPRLRPYTFDEMCEAVRKHGMIIKVKGINEVWSIGSFDDENVFYKTATFESYKEFLKNNAWFDDGSSCGILEE